MKILEISTCLSFAILIIYKYKGTVTSLVDRPSEEVIVFIKDLVEGIYFLHGTGA